MNFLDPYAPQLESVLRIVAGLLFLHIGIAKLLGVCALLAPDLARIKEWAYAGFAIVIISASYSHLNSGDGLKALEPLATLAALAVSYWGRPVNRQVFFLPRRSTSRPSTRSEAIVDPERAR